MFKEERGNLIKRRKELVKVISDLCEKKAPGTRFDRFFVQEFSKKLKVMS